MFSSNGINKLRLLKEGDNSLVKVNVSVGFYPQEIMS